MRRQSIALLSLCGLIALAVALTACNGFWVSSGSLDHVQVLPTTAVLNTTNLADTVQFSATAFKVDGTSTVVTSDPGTTWTSSNTSIVTVSSSGVVAPVAAGNATITAVNGGKTSNTVQILVDAFVSSSITMTVGSTTVPAGSTTNLTIQDNNSQIIPASFVSWSVSSAASNITVTTSMGNNPATLSVPTGTTPGSTIIVTATVTTNTNSTLTATSPTITTQ